MPKYLAHVLWSPGRRKLLAGLGCQCFHNCYVLQQLLQYAVTFQPRRRAVVGEPDFSLGIFPDQNLEREVDGDTGSDQHQGCAGLGTAEDQQLGGTHLQSYFVRFSAMVDESEQSDSLRCQNPLELFYRLVYRVIAGFVDDAVTFVER